MFGPLGQKLLLKTLPRGVLTALDPSDKRIGLSLGYFFETSAEKVRI